MTPIHQHRNTERTLLAAGLRNIHAPNRHRVPARATAVHTHRHVRSLRRRQGNLAVDPRRPTPGIALGDLPHAHQRVRPRPQHQFLQRPDRGPVLLPRRLENPAPQPDYVLLMGTPINSVPIERDALGSVHRDGVQLAPSVHQAIGLGVQRLTCPRQHPFRVRPHKPASGRFPTTTAWSSSHAVASPVAFRPPASASWASCPAEGFCPSYDRPTGPTRPGPRRGFHVPRTRDTTGMGAPYTPRPAVFPRPALTFRSPLAAPSSGQALSPRYSSRLPGLEITKHHQGFTHVHPPGLPLARLLP